MQIAPNRLTQLLLLAVTVLIYSVLGMTIGNSLFVSYVGAEHLPPAFLLISASCSSSKVFLTQGGHRFETSA